MSRKDLEALFIAECLSWGGWFLIAGWAHILRFTWAAAGGLLIGTALAAAQAIFAHERR